MNPSKPTRVSRRRALQIVGATAAAPLSPAAAHAGEAADLALVPGGRDQPFDADWRFALGDGPEVAQREFDDAAWRRLDLPHDWSIEDRGPTLKAVNGVVRDIDTAPLWQPVTGAPKAIGPFVGGATLIGEGDPSNGGHDTGHTVGGVGWYRKRFRLPPLPADGRAEIVFDGVYMNAQVFLNGRLLAEHPYGYTPFVVDLTPHLSTDGENVLAVRVANLGRNSRWYSGSGIYRHVRLNLIRQQRFGQWGLRVTTPTVSVDQATVLLRAKLESLPAGAMVACRLRDPAGKLVAESQSPASAETVARLELRGPRLWSPETPALYTAECELLAGGSVLDRMSTTFGVRRVEVDAQNGLRINGRSYKLRGGCLHHDNGLLGAAAIDRAEVRKIELLKARGFNAVRTSHNPPSPALLDACDRLGMLVIEEPFDCWRVGKNPDDYAQYFDGWWRTDLETMVARDGNHPSVIMWSIGNEIPETGKPDGVQTARQLAEAFRALDPLRPLTQAINTPNGPDVTLPDGRPDQAATQFLDVVGYNYKMERARPEDARFPHRVVVSTESFPNQAVGFWRLIDANPSLIGEFVWTAMDYLGESGIGRSFLSGSAFVTNPPYPWFNAFCGDIDLIGGQKPQSLQRDVIWGLSPLEVAVQRPLPEGVGERISPWGWRDELHSWTWQGQEGKLLNVRVYTLGDRVELTLNGRKVAEKAMTDADMATALLSVPYAPGKLIATAYRGGRRIGQRTLETAGAPAALRVRVDRPRIPAVRGELAHVTVEVVDGSGRLVPDAVTVIEAALTGPAELAAFGNANPRGVASFRQPVAKTWHGRALAILRPTGEAGALTLEVRAEGLRSATARVVMTSA
jgi:beta-galactosidase